MIPKVKTDILDVLTKAQIILDEREAKDYIELRDLSNHVIENASLYQDEDSISIAVLVYSVFKILERMPFLDSKLYNQIDRGIKNAKTNLKAGDEKKYQASIKRLFTIIDTIDSRFKRFIQEVVRKAKITKGTRMVEHGLSVAKAASLMGVSQWEMMSYFGKTDIVDRQDFSTSVKKRLDYARRLFK